MPKRSGNVTKYAYNLALGPEPKNPKKANDSTQTRKQNAIISTDGNSKTVQKFGKTFHNSVPIAYRYNAEYVSNLAAA